MVNNDERQKNKGNKRRTRQMLKSKNHQLEIMLNKINDEWDIMLNGKKRPLEIMLNIINAERDIM
jgi:hypothetical protein